MGPEANQAFSRVVSKFHFTLKIPIATYVHAEGPATASLPYHSPTQLLSVLLEKYPWLLMGGCDQEECCRQLLLAFWDCYEQEHPEHEIFKQKNRDRLGKTIPLTMHGDGGRTQKKQPLEICSLQPVLGLNSASCASVSCHCPTSVKHGSGQFGDPLRQCLNSKHNTYMTHFLLFAYPSKSYKDFANLLHGLLQCVCDDLAEVCKSGIKTAGGRHYYFASVGFKLDMEWMAKIGSLTRSYQNVGHVNQIPCCHECDAGAHNVHFEDVNPNARWIATRFATLPWVRSPPWSKIPFDSRRPAKFLRRDAFHVFRLGIGRNFLASCIMLMCFMGCPLHGNLKEFSV